MSLLRKGALVSGGQVVVIALTTVTGMLFARCLGPDGIGRYDLLRTTIQMAGSILALGIGNANVYFLNSRHVSPELIVSHSLKVGAALGAILCTVLMAALLSTPSYFGAVSVSVSLLLSLGAACQLLADLLYPVLVAQLAAKRMVSVLLGRASFLLLAGAAFAALGLLTSDAAILLLAGSFAVGLGITVAYLRPYLALRTVTDWRLLRSIVEYGIKLCAAGLMYLMSLNVSLFLLRYIMPGDFGALGLYARATTICGLIVLLPRTIAPLLYAKWSMTEPAQRTKQVEMVARFNFSLGVIAGIGVLVLGKPMLWLLYGTQFTDASPALKVLAPGLVCVALFNVFIQLLASDGKAAITAWILAGTCLITAMVTVAMVPHVGIIGAALGVMAGNLFAVLCAFAVCAREYGIRPSRCLLLRKEDLSYGRRALFARGRVEAFRPPAA